MKQEKYLMIGASVGSKELVQDAKESGCYTIAVGPEGTTRSIYGLGADEVWILDTSDIDEIERRCRESGVTAAMAGVSEFNLEVCIELCRRLGLPFYSTIESRVYEDSKAMFKKLARETGAPVSPDYYVSLDPTEEELKNIQYPVVVKAINLSANRGMSFVYREDQMLPALNLARNMSGKDEVVVEKLLTGREYAVHYVMADGEPEFLCMVTLLSPKGCPTSCYSITITESDQLQNYIENVDEPVRCLLKKAGIREGICWFEMMADNQNLYLLELGFRLSGLQTAMCYDHVYDFNEYRWINETSRGIKHTVKQLPAREDCLKYREKVSVSYVIWSDARGGEIGAIEGVEEIASMDGVVVEQWLKPGDVVAPYRYLIFFIIKAENHDQLIQMIEKINSCIRFKNRDGENMAILYEDYDELRALHEDFKRQTR